MKKLKEMIYKHKLNKYLIDGCSTPSWQWSLFKYKGTHIYVSFEMGEISLIDIYREK